LPKDFALGASVKPLHAFFIGIIAAMLGGCNAATPPTGALKAAATPLLPTPKGRNLLYVSNGQAVYVYTFPRGKSVGLVSGPLGPKGLCTDKLGDIFVPWVYNVGGVNEYAHGGGTPIAYLGVDFNWPNGCSINPKTGALAVVAGPNNERAVVAVYRYERKRGWGLSRDYSASFMAMSDFCGYDDKGNLFIDGKDSSGKFVLAELPKGGKSFVPIAVTQTIEGPGQIQWDGQHLAIGDTGVSPSVLYQFDISGSGAVNVGSTTLSDSKTVEQFWIQGNTVVAPDSKRTCGSSTGGCIAIYGYPNGGNAINTVALPGALGATISLAR
jgi:hypothetical protein